MAVASNIPAGGEFQFVPEDQRFGRLALKTILVQVPPGWLNNRICLVLGEDSSSRAFRISLEARLGQRETSLGSLMEA
jgi:hypothetical protein